jgi:flagellar protein FlaG
MTRTDDPLESSVLEHTFPRYGPKTIHQERHNPDYPRSPDFCYGESLLEESDTMSIPQQPNIRLVNAADYRDTYANSIQIRVSVWDFLLVFGRLQPVTTQEVEVQNFQGIYLSPQQAKALLTILEQNVRQYEGTFGEIKLDPSMAAQQGQIN